MVGKANNNNSGNQNQGNQNSQGGQQNNSTQATNNQQNSQNQGQNNSQGFSQDDNGKVYSEEELRALLEVGRKTAKEEFLKSIGLSDETELQGIISKHNVEEEKNQTDFDKLEKENGKLQKQLFAEQELRKLAETKLLALKFGAKPDTVDDLVVLVKSKIGDKDFKEETLAKSLDALKTTYPFYFVEQGSGGDDEHSGQGTRGSLKGKMNGDQGGNGNNGGQGAGGNSGSGGTKSLAERLVANKKGKNKKSNYFTRR